MPPIHHLYRTSISLCFRHSLIVLASFSMFDSVGAANDLETIRDRVIEYARKENQTSSASIASYLSSQLEDGSWPDIHYNEQNDAGWPATAHLDRLLKMSAVYRTSGHEYFEDETLRQEIVKGLNFWVDADLKSINWWWNVIGGPQRLAPILLLMQPYIASELVDAGLPELEEAPSNIGQNRVWISNIVIQRGLLEGNEDRVASGVEGITSTIEITTGEGIQVDGTFYQHGKFIHNGSYGLSYIEDLALWGEFLSDTAYTFQGTTSDVLAKLILDGTGWMVRYDDIDYSVKGRSISRSGNTASANKLRTPITQMIAVGDTYQPRYQALLDHINQKSESAPFEIGQKHFWRADYSVNRSAQFLISLRMFSNRTSGGESINEENLKGLYLSFGTTLIYRDGVEYDNIMPAWDWSKLPGTTLEQKPGNPYSYGSIGIGRSTYVGGASNGFFGMSAFLQDDNRNGATACKSWFFFDQGMIALGANIRCSTDNSVFTTINQCNLRGPNLLTGSIVMNDGENELELPIGEQTLSAPSWIHHDGVGYVFPHQHDVYLSNLRQSGRWYDINHSGSTSTTNPKVFLLGIDHGVASSPKDYVYYVLPIGDETAVAAFVDRDPIQILANSAEIQAVRHNRNGQTGVTFYQPGSIEVEPGLELSTDTACIVLTSRSSTETGIKISVANPLAEEDTVTLRVSGKLTGTNTTYLVAEDATDIVFDLPGDEYGGSTVTQTFQIESDLDSDGFDDRWERAHFNTLDHNMDGDTDRDAYSDQDEYAAGTSPTDPTDIPQLEINRESIDSLRLSFEARAFAYPGRNRFYSIEGISELNSGQWISLPESGEIQGNGTPVEVESDLEAYDFYRLRYRLD